jgi:serine/threonine-protein kinase
MFVCTEGAPPAMLSTVLLQVERPNGGPLRLSGEVVRHVSPAEARAWNMRPGFGVQFVGLTPDQRQALAVLVEQRPATVAPPRTTTPIIEAVPENLALLLEHYRERLEGSHYDLLGLNPGADFDQIREAARVLKEELQAIPTPGSPATTEQVNTVVERLEAAAKLLGDPLNRLRYDAQRGNFAGAQHSKQAGVPQARFEELHQEHLTRRPEDAARAAVHLGRARLARKTAQGEAELGELEAALRLTPLDWAALERHEALRQELGR